MKLLNIHTKSLLMPHIRFQSGRPEYGITPLMQALQERNVDHVQKLLQDASLDINAQDDEGNTALHYLANDQHGVRFLRLLVKRSEIDLNRPNNEGLTPAMIAARCGNYTVFEAFYTLGADLWAKNSVNRRTTAYDIAHGFMGSSYGCLCIVNFLNEKYPSDKDRVSKTEAPPAFKPEVPAYNMFTWHRGQN